jgi:DHA2 family multidrug resistance protein
MTEADAWRVLACVIFGLFMVLLDQTVVNVAFATIQKQFTADVAEIQWVISLYVMVIGIATPLSGFMADRFGHKRVFLSALALFTFGSLLCGLSPSLWTLIAARALQAVGGGLALPIGTAMLFAAFPPHERGKAMGVFGIAMVVAPALGPILGGWLVDAGHWRWIFFLNVPIGIFGVLLGSAWLRPKKGHAGARYDPIGLLFSTVGFASVLYAASVASDRGWSAPSVVTWFVVGAVSLVIFALVELRFAKEALLDLTLFKNSIFLSAALTGYVSVIALFGAEFLLPLYLQLLRGRTALEAGVLLLPMAVAAALSTPFSGRLFDRIGARPLAVAGFSLLAVNTWQLSKLTADTPMSWIEILLFIRGVALGLTVQTTMLTGLSVVPLKKTARASALINSTRQVVQAIGVAILATILASAVSPELSAQLRKFQESAPAQTASAGPRFELCNLPAPPVSVPGAPPGMPPQALGMIKTFCGQYIDGLEHDYKVTFYASLVAILLGAILPGWPGKWSRRSGGEPSIPSH